MYWFDRCGNSLTNSKLNLFLVYLWNIDDDLFQENNPNHVYYYKNDGILRRGSIQESCPCIVKKIHCLFNHQILKHSQYEQINCIEDFILYLGSFSITPKTDLLYISSLGWSSLIQSLMSDSNVNNSYEYLQSQELKQLIHILQAYQSSSNFWKNELNEMNNIDIDFTITTIARDIFITFEQEQEQEDNDQEDNLEEKFNQVNSTQPVFYELKNNIIKLFLSQNEQDWTQQLNILYHNLILLSTVISFDQNNDFNRIMPILSEFIRSINLLLYNYVGISNTYSLIYNCNKEQEDVNICPEYLMSSMKTSSLFFEIFENILQTIPIELYSKSLVLEISTFNYIKSIYLQIVNFFNIENSIITINEPTEVQTFQSLYNTMFLIFVYPYEVNLAETFVAKWRMFTITAKVTYSYHIIPIDDCNSEYEHLSYSSKKKIKHSIPCFRSIILNIEQWMNEFCTNQDRIVVLIGIDSLNSLITPKNLVENLNSRLFVAESQYFSQESTTLYSLIFALDVFNNNNNNNNNIDDNDGNNNINNNKFPLPDIRLFTGFARDIQFMIDSIRKSPLYTFTENSIILIFQLFCINSVYSQINSELVIYIDVNYEYFDFNIPFSLPSFLPSIQRDITNVFPNNEIYSIFQNVIYGDFIESTTLQIMLDYIFQLCDPNTIVAFFQFYQSIVTIIPFDLDFLFISILLQWSRTFDYLDHSLTYEEKIKIVQIVETILVNYYSTNKFISLTILQRDGLGYLSILHDLLSSLYMNLGHTQTSIIFYQTSYIPPTHLTFYQYSQSWKLFRNYYNPSSSSSYKTWYFTIATKFNEKLENLLLSAKIAEVEIKVLGKDLDFKSLDKIELYYEAIFSSLNLIDDNDVIVFMDGYDVLLTPASQFIGQRLSKSSTPLIYGAENGLFPHSTASWITYRGITSFSNRDNKNKRNVSKWNSLFPRKYPNSGTFVGRAKETKLMLKELYEIHLSSAGSISSVYREEQHLITRYYLQHPELLSIDNSNEIFLSLYQFPLDYFLGFNSLFQLELNTTIASKYDISNFRFNCVNLIHGNGIQGKKLYDLLSSSLRKVYQEYYLQNNNNNNNNNSLRNKWKNNIQLCLT